MNLDIDNQSTNRHKQAKTEGQMRSQHQWLNDLEFKGWLMLIAIFLVWIWMMAPLFF